MSLATQRKLPKATGLLAACCLLLVCLLLVCLLPAAGLLVYT